MADAALGDVSGVEKPLQIVGESTEYICENIDEDTAKHLLMAGIFWAAKALMMMEAAKMDIKPLI
jgi:hypothetical protein